MAFEGDEVNQGEAVWYKSVAASSLCKLPIGLVRHLLTHVLKDSGLAAVMTCIGDPLYVVNQARIHKDDGEDSMVDVFRHQRLQDSLTAMLMDWTPATIVSSWKPQDILFRAKPFDGALV